MDNTVKAWLFLAALLLTPIFGLIGLKLLDRVTVEYRSSNIRAAINPRPAPETTHSEPEALQAPTALTAAQLEQNNTDRILNERIRILEARASSAEASELAQAALNRSLRAQIATLADDADNGRNREETPDTAFLEERIRIADERVRAAEAAEASEREVARALRQRLTELTAQLAEANKTADALRRARRAAERLSEDALRRSRAAEQASARVREESYRAVQELAEAKLQADLQLGRAAEFLARLGYGPEDRRNILKYGTIAEPRDAVYAEKRRKYKAHQAELAARKKRTRDSANEYTFKTAARPAFSGPTFDTR